MTVKLLTEYNLEFLSLKGGCTGSSESTLVKMSNCWKSRAAAHLIYYYFFQTKVASISIPNIYSTSGNCRYKDNEQLLTIKFFNETWTLSITIAYENQGAKNQGTRNTPYSWKDINFACVLYEELFPDILPEQKGNYI